MGYSEGPHDGLPPRTADPRGVRFRLNTTDGRYLKSKFLALGFTGRIVEGPKGALFSELLSDHLQWNAWGTTGETMGNGWVAFRPRLFPEEARLVFRDWRTLRAYRAPPWVIEPYPFQPGHFYLPQYPARITAVSGRRSARSGESSQETDGSPPNSQEVQFDF